MLEVHLADCPECLAAIAEVRAMLDEGVVATAPDEVIRAARSLVDDADIPPTYRFVQWPALRRAAGWSMAAAASLAVCVVGYRVGSGASVGQAVNEDVLLSEMSFGLMDSEPGLDMLNLAGLEQGGIGP